MTEAESRVNGEGTDDESMVFEAAVSESAQVEAGDPLEAAGSDSTAEPSENVIVNVAEEASTVVPKVRVEENKEQTVKIEALDEGTNKGALRNPAKRVQKRKKVALAIAGTSAAATKNEEEKTAVEDKDESTISKEEGKKEEVPGERKKVNNIKKVKKLQRTKTEASANPGTAKDDKIEKMDVTDIVEGAVSNEEGNDDVVLDEEEKVNQEMKTTDLTIAASAVVTGETANGDGEKEKLADKDKDDKSLNKKNKRRKKKNKTQVAAAEAAGAAEVGVVEKFSVEKEYAGMIFMCSSETKKDCYRYKVFGMPAGKKEAVAKVYKGMKLFLYDIDLKLLYGIYIATSKGGYNIQPKAFKSAFPSQVRFKVLKDYLPLPEEKFKAAVKANYYQKKKFRLELSAEQVKNLSKLFVEATNTAKRPKDRATRERVPRNITARDTKRRQVGGTDRRLLIDEGDRRLPRTRDMYEREDYASQVPLQVPFPPHGSAVPRHAPLPLYSSPPRLATLTHLPPPAYVYERPRDVNYYLGELPREAHGYRAIDPEVRLPLDHVLLNDPYSLRREPAPHHETHYTLTLPSSYHAPAPPPYRY